VLLVSEETGNSELPKLASLSCTRVSLHRFEATHLKAHLFLGAYSQLLIFGLEVEVGKVVARTREGHVNLALRVGSDAFNAGPCLLDIVDLVQFDRVDHGRWDGRGMIALSTVQVPVIERGQQRDAAPTIRASPKRLGHLRINLREGQSAASTQGGDRPSLVRDQHDGRMGRGDGTGSNGT
jgi:hypothetical protein